MQFPMCKCQTDESVWYLYGYMTIEIHQTLKLIQKSINYHENFSFSAHINVILKKYWNRQERIFNFWPSLILIIWNW